MTLRLARHQMIEPALQRDDEFAEWYVETWMRKAMPEYMYRQDPRTLKEMTLSARSYARHFGIDDVESQAVFVTLCWDMGPGFFLWPGFREICTDATLTGPQKIAAIEAVDEERAIDAIEGRDSRLWFDAPLPPMRGRRADG